LPKAIAHRTFSADGKRRISLELVERNPHWASIGRTEVPSDDSGQVGSFRFEVRDETVEISWPGGAATTPRSFFRRGPQALVAYELHLEHNEFEGGFNVHDLGEDVALRAHGYEERLPGVRCSACSMPSSGGWPEGPTRRAEL